MKIVDTAALMALPDEAFAQRAWAALAGPGHAVPLHVAVSVHRGESRLLTLLRAWLAAMRVDPAARHARLEGPGMRAARLAARLPGGVRLLALGLAVRGRVTGRTAERLGMKLRDLSVRLEVAETALSVMHERTEALAHEIRRAGDAAMLRDDLVRRIDLMAFELRQAAEAVALRAEERQSVANAAQAASRHLEP